jgi:phytoene synthase
MSLAPGAPALAVDTAAPPPAARAPAGSLRQAKAHARAVVRRSGTSFYWGMRLLPRPRREAMFAIYAFCRAVDDIADEPGAPAAKLAALDEWRAEVEALYQGRPRRLETLALQPALAAFALPKDELLAMIDGMAMDAGGRMQAPPMAELQRYCRRVAGTVGLLSMSVFGQRGSKLDRGALALAEALQLTNVLRDLVEDAARGRLYLPRELLDQYGYRGRDPQQALADPNIAGVCRALATRAERCFELAERLLATGDRRKLKPALIMMAVYRLTLARLIARGWDRLERPVRIGRLERLWLGLRLAFS